MESPLSYFSDLTDPRVDRTREHSLIEKAGEWAGLKCLIQVDSVRYFKCDGKEEKDTRLYISSLDPEARSANIRCVSPAP